MTLGFASPAHHWEVAVQSVTADEAKHQALGCNLAVLLVDELRLRNIGGATLARGLIDGVINLLNNFSRRPSSPGERNEDGAARQRVPPGVE